MAFNSSTFTLNGIASGVHLYKTSDTLTALLATGYFSNIISSISSGDIIYVTTPVFIETNDTTSLNSLHKITLTIDATGTAKVAGSNAIQTPLSIFPTTLSAWYDTEDESSVIVQGADVRQWKDKSGNGNHLVAPFTAGQTPTLAADGGIAVTGGQHLDSVKTFAKRYFYVVASTTAEVTGASTSQCLIEFSELAFSLRLGASHSAFSTEIIAGIEQDGIGTDHRVGIGTAIIPLIPPKKHIYGLFYDGATNLQEMAFDGSADLANLNSLTPNINNALSSISLGSRNSGSTPFQGVIYEAIFFSEAPTLQQEKDITKYLIEKYEFNIETVIAAGQSNIARMFIDENAGNSRASFRETYYQYANNYAVNFYNGAEGGSYASRKNALTHPGGSNEYWVDDSDPDNLKRGPLLIAFEEKVLQTLTPIDYAILMQGEADGVRMNVEVGAMTSAAEMLPTYRFFVKEVSDIIGNKPVYIGDLARRGEPTSVQRADGYEIMREVHRTIIADTDYAHKGTTHYDLPNIVGDSVHVTPTGLAIAARRYVLARLFEQKQLAYGIGSQLTSASRTGSTFTLTVTHNGATGFGGTLLGNNPLAFTSGSNQMVITMTAHGFAAAGQINLSGIAADIAGLTQAQLNATFTIASVTTNTITVTLPANANATITGGGALVRLLRLTNRQALATTLGNNPLAFASSGSTVMTIAMANHGLAENERLLISGAVDTLGIAAANINGNRFVSTVIDANNFTINILSGTSNASGAGGGSAVNVTPAKRNFFRVFRNSDGRESIVSNVTLVLPNQITLQVDNGVSPASSCTVYAGYNDMQWLAQGATGLVQENQVLRDNSPDNLPLQTNKIVMTS